MHPDCKRIRRTDTEELEICGNTAEPEQAWRPWSWWERSVKAVGGLSSLCQKQNSNPAFYWSKTMQSPRSSDICEHFRFTVTLTTVGVFRINSSAVSNIPEIHQLLRRIVVTVVHLTPLSYRLSAAYIKWVCNAYGAANTRDATWATWASARLK
jgi:hypothetical protein